MAEFKDEYDLTIVMVTHDLSHVARISDRLAVMYAFEVLELGPVENVVVDPAHPYTRALLEPDFIPAVRKRGRRVDGTLQS